MPAQSFKTSHKMTFFNYISTSTTIYVYYNLTWIQISPVLHIGSLNKNNSKNKRIKQNQNISFKRTGLWHNSLMCNLYINAPLLLIHSPHIHPIGLHIHSVGPCTLHTQECLKLKKCNNKTYTTGHQSKAKTWQAIWLYWVWLIILLTTTPSQGTRFFSGL